MKRKKGASKTRFVLRIKGLPADAVAVSEKTYGGALIYADKFGSIYAVRRETVVYRILQGTEGT